VKLTYCCCLRQQLQVAECAMLCRVPAVSPSLRLAAILQVAAPACRHVGLITTHHLLGAAVRLAQGEQASAGRHRAHRQAGRQQHHTGGQSQQRGHWVKHSEEAPHAHSHVTKKARRTC
jgi:hypothetical protein